MSAKKRPTKRPSVRYTSDFGHVDLTAAEIASCERAGVNPDSLAKAVILEVFRMRVEACARAVLKI